MKTLSASACLALFAILLPLSAIAQVSGSKPFLFTYFHNSSPNGIIPAVNGDTIGGVRFKALASGTGNIRIGAAIDAFIDGPVNASFLPTSMVFRTGSSGLYNRMIIDKSGLVGIGTMTPQYHLDVVGNTHTSGRFFGRIHLDKNLTTNDAPNTYIDEAYFETKQRALLGLPAGPGAFGGVLSLAPGNGGFDHQLYFGDDGIFTRRHTGSAADWIGANWFKLLTGEDINGTPNRVAKFTGPNSIGDSQLFDNGTLVGIGTTAPDAASLLTVAGNTRINGDLRSTGNVQFDQNLNVTQHITGAQNISAGANLIAGANLSVANNAAIGNDAAINGDLSVDQTAHVGQTMTIGTNTTASGYTLSVGGGIIAEEVRVQIESAWPDYVFESDYKLPDLPALEQFLQTNNHLPGIPTAAEVAENGIDLGEMNRRLLEKVEELTLLLIEQQKQIDQIKSKLPASGK